MKRIFWLLLGLVGCLGCAQAVPLKDSFQIDENSFVAKLPLKVGFYVDPATWNFVDSVRPRGLVASTQAFKFPIGNSLSKMMVMAAGTAFDSVAPLEALPREPGAADGYDVYMTITDLEVYLDIQYADRTPTIKVPIANMVTGSAAEGRCDLTLTVRIQDRNLNLLYDSILMGSGKDKVKALRLPGRGIDFAGAVNQAMQSLTEDFIQRLAQAHALREYAGSRVQTKGAA